jgi:hypothetical protein
MDRGPIHFEISSIGGSLNAFHLRITLRVHRTLRANKSGTPT